MLQLKNASPSARVAAAVSQTGPRRSSRRKEMFVPRGFRPFAMAADPPFRRSQRKVVIVRHQRARPGPAPQQSACDRDRIDGRRMPCAGRAPPPQTFARWRGPRSAVRYLLRSAGFLLISRTRPEAGPALTSAKCQHASDKPSSRRVSKRAAPSFSPVVPTRNGTAASASRR